MCNWYHFLCFLPITTYKMFANDLFVIKKYLFRSMAFPLYPTTSLATLIKEYRGGPEMILQNRCLGPNHYKTIPSHFLNLFSCFIAHESREFLTIISDVPGEAVSQYSRSTHYPLARPVKVGNFSSYCFTPLCPRLVNHAHVTATRFQETAIQRDLLERL